MPTNVNGTPEDSQLQGPLSGEPGSAANLIRQLIQPVANKVEFLRAYINQTRECIAGLTKPRVIGISLECGSAGSGWTKLRDTTTGRVMWRQSSAPVSGEWLMFEITPYLPDYGEIVEIGGEFYAADGHSELPTVFASVAIKRASRQSLSNELVLGTKKFDSSSSVASYESLHPIKSNHAVQIDTFSERYYFTVEGEAGASYKAGFTVVGLYVKVRL